MSISTFIAGLFIQGDIAKLEAAFEAIEAKAKAAVPVVVADVELEVAKAKAIFAAYKPKAEAELAKVEAEIEAAEAAVAAFAKKL